MASLSCQLQNSSRKDIALLGIKWGSPLTPTNISFCCLVCNNYKIVAESPGTCWLSFFNTIPNQSLISTQCYSYYTAALKRFQHISYTKAPKKDMLFCLPSTTHYVINVLNGFQNIQRQIKSCRKISKFHLRGFNFAIQE